MDLIEITKCGGAIGPNGRDWCPFEYDSHCSIGNCVDTKPNSVPQDCPLRKSSVGFQLKAEVLLGE